MPNPVQAPTVIHSTFVLERSYAVTPERVFAAFADPSIKRRWYAHANSRSVEEFHMDFRVGGVDQARYRLGEDTPFPGVALLNSTTYQNIVSNRRIVFTSTMTIGDNPISSSLVTFEMLPTETGTDLILTEQGAYFENSGGPDMRKDGWARLLQSLAVELNS